MKVGDLVVYNLGPRAAAPGDEKAENVAIVVKERIIACNGHGPRNFLIYYPHHNEHLNGWEDEYRVIS